MTQRRVAASRTRVCAGQAASDDRNNINTSGQRKKRETSGGVCVQRRGRVTNARKRRNRTRGRSAPRSWEGQVHRISHRDHFRNVLHTLRPALPAAAVQPSCVLIGAASCAAITQLCARFSSAAQVSAKRRRGMEKKGALGAEKTLVRCERFPVAAVSAETRRRNDCEAVQVTSSWHRERCESGQSLPSVSPRGDRPRIGDKVTSTQKT